MSKRYKNLGEEPDKIFARGGAAVSERKKELEERAEKEQQEIGCLVANPIFVSWFKRIVRQQGGFMTSSIRDEAGQAQSLTLYYIAKDLARTEEGGELVAEIVREQLGSSRVG